MSAAPALIICHEIVASRMAGPGIRAWHLATEMARHLDVILAVPGEAGLDGPPFEVCSYRRRDWSSLSRAAHRSGVIIAAGDTLAEFPALERLDVPLVIDGYDPHTVETLALWAGEPLAAQAGYHSDRVSIVRRQCRAADFLICASQRQRDWWLGVLEEQGRVNPLTYQADPSLRRLVDVVPFGLPAAPPLAARPAIRGIWPGIGADDWIVLWGGGLWEWLDPLTALRAARRLADDGWPLRLVFPGTRHPNPAMPDMPMRARALALADELELTGRTAFFGDWVPYADWPAVLLESDVGLSLHPDTVEARLAYRTRVLDYIWAGLPVVLTGGDETAEMAVRYDLGATVGYGDDAALAHALSELFAHGRAGLRDWYRPRFEAARCDLTWERAAAPLVAFCLAPRRSADRQDRPGHRSLVWPDPKAGESAPPANPEVPSLLGPALAVEEEPMTEASSCIEGRASPPVSVIVLTWNGAAYIEACLSALLDQRSAALEILVVDNGSTDGTADFVARRFPGVHLFRQPRNLGFSAGNNIGLRAAAGDVLVLLNQDTRVHPGWLAALCAAFDDASVGIAGCKLLYPDGTIQHAGGFTYGPRGETDHRGRGAPDDGRFDEAADAEFVTGAALAIRRAAMVQIGLLDEGFSPAYYEDIDWCYRARAAGWRVVYAPEAVVTHFESTATAAETYDRKFAVNQGRTRQMVKHWPLDRLLGEFSLAEQAWVRRLDRSIEVMSARRAYLAALMDLPAIVAFRQAVVPGAVCPPQVEAEALLGMLIDLRAAAIASLEALEVSGSEPQAPVPGAAKQERELPSDADALHGARLLDELEAWQTLHERPFTSKLPIIGRFIVAVRTAWNSISTKWYIRPMAQQQSAVNAGIIAYLRIFQDKVNRTGWLERVSGEQATILRGQLQESAENVRELTALAERLARVEAEVARGHAAGAPSKRGPREGARR